MLFPPGRKTTATQLIPENGVPALLYELELTPDANELSELALRCPGDHDITPTVSYQAISQEL